MYMDMSKLEAGMFEIEEDAFDMSELMVEVAALVDAQLLNRESHITDTEKTFNIPHCVEAPCSCVVSC